MQSCPVIDHRVKDSERESDLVVLVGHNYSVGGTINDDQSDCWERMQKVHMEEHPEVMTVVNEDLIVNENPVDDRTHCRDVC